LSFQTFNVFGFEEDQNGLYTNWRGKEAKDVFMGHLAIGQEKQK
jgi:hypothetical protein